MGLYPVVAAGYNLRGAVQLSLLLFLITLPTALTRCFLGGLVPNWLRPGAVLVISAGAYLPAAWYLNQIFPGSLNALGIYAGLTVCNSMLLSRCNDYAPFHLARAVLAMSLADARLFCGFVRFCLLAGISPRGSVWNTNVGTYIAADKGTALPFFGFLLLGFAAALAKWADGRRNKKTERRVPRA
ncbi:MAG: Rnf-Nqr domain containing protein [Acutalibacteraceae bacterium]